MIFILFKMQIQLHRSVIPIDLLSISSMLINIARQIVTLPIIKTSREAFFFKIIPPPLCHVTFLTPPTTCPLLFSSQSHSPAIFGFRRLCPRSQKVTASALHRKCVLEPRRQRRAWYRSQVRVRVETHFACRRIPAPF